MRPEYCLSKNSHVSRLTHRKPCGREPGPGPGKADDPRVGSSLRRAGRTYRRLAGRVTALDWPVCAHLARAGPAPNRVRRRATSPQPPLPSGMHTSAEPPPFEVLTTLRSRLRSLNCFFEMLTATIPAGRCSRVLLGAGPQEAGEAVPVRGGPDVGPATGGLGDEDVTGKPHDPVAARVSKGTDGQGVQCVCLGQPRRIPVRLGGCRTTCAPAYRGRSALLRAAGRVSSWRPRRSAVS